MRILRSFAYFLLFICVLIVSTLLIFFSPLLPCSIGLMDCSYIAFATMFIAPPLGCCISPILFALLYNAIHWLLNHQSKQKRKNKHISEGFG